MSSEEEIAPVEEGNDHLSVTIHKQVQSSLASTTLEEKFNELVSFIHEADQKPKLRPLIQRVPFMLRDNKNFEMYYEPRTVSIGPLHHGKTKFKQSEQLKVKLTALFIKVNGLREKDLYEKIKNEMASLRKCYKEDEIKSFNDEDLSWVFFVDGCTLLHYIDRVAQNKVHELEIKAYHTAFAGQDLFMFENQLPDQLLKILMSSCNPLDQERLKNSIHDFILNTVNDIRGSKVQRKFQAEPEEPTHLLELLWRRLVRTTEQRTPRFFSFPYINERRAALIDFHYVNDLRAAGIGFQSRNEGFLNEISFTSRQFSGTLTLPSIIVDESTAPRFLNLIAYEMCPDFDNYYEITSYVAFLCTLIHQPSEVKELGNAQILHNFLGSDEVAELFNEIGIGLKPNPEMYKQIRDDIQKHCEKILKTWRRKWKTWYAQLLHDYFRSPWTFLAFVGATAALLLTFLQTVYTMKSAASSC